MFTVRLIGSSYTSAFDKWMGLFHSVAPSTLWSSLADFHNMSADIGLSDVSDVLFLPVYIDISLLQRSAFPLPVSLAGGFPHPYIFPSSIALLSSVASCSLWDFRLLTLRPNIVQIASCKSKALVLHFSHAAKSAVATCFGMNGVYLLMISSTL